VGWRVGSPNCADLVERRGTRPKLPKLEEVGGVTKAAKTRLTTSIEAGTDWRR